MTILFLHLALYLDLPGQGYQRIILPKYLNKHPNTLGHHPLHSQWSQPVIVSSMSP